MSAPGSPADDLARSFAETHGNMPGGAYPCAVGHILASAETASRRLRSGGDPRAALLALLNEIDRARAAVDIAAELRREKRLERILERNREMAMDAADGPLTQREAA